MRRRSGSTRSATNGEETSPFTPGAGLSASAMVSSTPQHHGSVLKLHIPVLYILFPAFLQRIILSLSCLRFLAPSWKERHLILCGSYLYKFKDRSSTTPKGSPFELETLTTDVLRANGSKRFPTEIGNLPAGYNGMFTVSTLRRTHFYAVSDTEEAQLWVRSLHEARQERITRNMGHASNVPYPSSWKYFDSLGKSLVKSKARIKERLDQSSFQEMEMVSFTDGPIPRGYHG